MEKTYLGDSVYYQFDGYHVVLTTENGHGSTNVIYLEPPVLQALIHAITKEPALNGQFNIPALNGKP